MRREGEGDEVVVVVKERNGMGWGDEKADRKWDGIGEDRRGTDRSVRPSP